MSWRFWIRLAVVAGLLTCATSEIVTSETFVGIVVTILELQ